MNINRAKMVVDAVHIYYDMQGKIDPVIERYGLAVRQTAKIAPKKETN